MWVETHLLDQLARQVAWVERSGDEDLCLEVMLLNGDDAEVTITTDIGNVLLEDTVRAFLIVRDLLYDVSWYKIARWTPYTHNELMSER